MKKTALRVQETEVGRGKGFPVYLSPKTEQSKKRRYGTCIGNREHEGNKEKMYPGGQVPYLEAS